MKNFDPDESVPNQVQRLIRNISAQMQIEVPPSDREVKWNSLPKVQCEGGSPQYGNTVIIRWGGEYEGIEDRGYLTTIPGKENDDPLVTGIVHVPNMEEPGEKARSESVWFSFWELNKNDYIRKVVVICSKRHTKP